MYKRMCIWITPLERQIQKTPPSTLLYPSVKIHQTIHSPSQLESNPVSHKNPAHHPTRRNKKLVAYDEADQTVRLATPKYDSENAEGLFATKSEQLSEHPGHVEYTEPAQSPQNLECQPPIQSKERRIR
jgi:hypothetical protein